MVIDRAIARSEVVHSVDAHALLIAATGPPYHHRLLLGRTLTTDDDDRYAQLAANAATTPVRTSQLPTPKGSCSAPGLVQCGFMGFLL